MDEAVIARIRHDMRAYHLLYDERTRSLIVEKSGGERFFCDCTRLNVLPPSQQDLSQFAFHAFYEALCCALAVYGWNAENDPDSLDAFAAWCDEVAVVFGGKATVAEALIEWRGHWKIWADLEAFLTKEVLLKYLDLFAVSEEIAQEKSST